MRWRTLMIIAGTLALLPAGRAAAYTTVLPTIGAGTLMSCKVTVEKRHDWPFGADFNYYSGTTDCTRAIDQSGQVRLEKTTTSEATSYGPVCSGFVASCSSSGEVNTQHDGLAVYRVQLVAPFGQAWVYSGDLCSGAGSDHITCEVHSNNFMAWST